MTRSRFRLWLPILAAGFVLTSTACITLLGPWPVYSDSRYRESGYFKTALREIESGALRAGLGEAPRPLHAGWASRDITPSVGTTMAGFGSRDNGKRSTGIRDRLFTHAVAFNDGADTAMIIVADMLVVPPRIAWAVRDALAETPGIEPDGILFNATHTHSGPGGFAPGLAGRLAGGKFNPEIESMIVRAMTDSARDAVASMAPVKLASGSAHVPRYIENRVRDDAPVDAELAFLALKAEGGREAFIVSYAAHPTVFNRHMLEFSRDYPGELQDALAEATGADVIFLSGAVGSMGDDRPKAVSYSESARMMGEGLSVPIIARSEDLPYEDAVDVAAFGFSMGMPPIQVRPVNAGFRISPWLARRIGIERKGWLQFLRLNDMLFVGLPFDFSGETSLVWKAWAGERDLDLWPVSFSGHYAGYLTPDLYYLDEPLEYETREMSWLGPNLEAYLTDLFHHAVEEMDSLNADPADDSAMASR
jgi:hypothetical protein